MRPKLIFIMAVFTLILVGCTNKTKGPEVAGDIFIRALAARDYDGAKKLSAGNVLYNLSRETHSKDIAAAEVIKSEVRCEASSDSWAEVTITIKVALENGEADISWYRLSMINIERQWKVYRFEPTGPAARGGGKGNSEDLVVAKAVFTDYLNSISSNDLDKAAGHLAGPARKKLELSRGVLGASPLISSVGEIYLTSLWQKEDLLVCQAEYIVDGRRAKVVVTYAKFSDADWKIADITNCS